MKKVLFICHGNIFLLWQNALYKEKIGNYKLILYQVYTKNRKIVDTA